MKYNIILKKLSLLLLSLTLMTSFVSCEEDDVTPEPNGVLTDDVRGTWVVDMYWDGDFYDHNTISTLNTGDNDADKIWIDDQGHGWGLLAKVNFDPNTLTFSATDADEHYYGVTVTINGSITKGGATTPSGETVDSIHFEVEFSDIPGEPWIYEGYKSTAKIEDYP
ncbi:lipid-binding protein [Gaetbulibacter sp. M235]|uniref:lipid-binding protein n=1 Tax=Gaetbulibacter sp. M235 TaxID=3126510 RepID=UPI00374EF74F